MMDELRAIAQAKKGDSEAFAFLVETYETSVYRLALRMCGNAHDAEEVAQEAFVAAWKGLPAFRGESKFSSWLYQLTTNACLDLLLVERLTLRHLLSLTNDDLLEMLRMKEDGEDPADFLSDKLDELLIDLEK